MRIISGKRRGVQLVAPEGPAVRPTADRTREGLFNLLCGGRYGEPFCVQVVADIFAGSGSLGLEAWSRNRSRSESHGAMQVVFVESDDAALAALKANIDKLGCGDDAHILAHDATKRWVWPTAPAGLVFLDPPWRKPHSDDDLAGLALANMIESAAIAADALVSIEHDHRSPPRLPPSVECRIEWLETRKWGRTACSLGRYAP